MYLLLFVRLCMVYLLNKNYEKRKKEEGICCSCSMLQLKILISLFGYCMIPEFSLTCRRKFIKHAYQCGNRLGFRILCTDINLARFSSCKESNSQATIISKNILVYSLLLCRADTYTFQVSNKQQQKISKDVQDDQIYQYSRFFLSLIMLAKATHLGHNNRKSRHQWFHKK